MRSCDTRTGHRCSRRRGFTLIELLVVIVILGISVGLITINLSRDQGVRLEEDARRLGLMLQHAHDDAIVSGQPVAWTAGPVGYVFMRKEYGRGWVPYLENSTRGSIATPLRSRLRVAGVDVPGGEPLVFSASAMGLPYELMLSAGEWSVTLTGDYAGRVSVTRASRGESSLR